MPASRTPAAIPKPFTSLGELLPFLRLRAGRTQRELPSGASYSESQISRREQNQRQPDEASLAARFVFALRLETDREWVARQGNWRQRRAPRRSRISPNPRGCTWMQP